MTGHPPIRLVRRATLLLALLLAACGGGEEPTPAPTPVVETGPVDDAFTRLRVDDVFRHNDPMDWAMPWDLRWPDGGVPWTWTSTMGGHPEDPPGPAAVFGDGALPGVTHRVLAGGQVCTGDGRPAATHVGAEALSIEEELLRGASIVRGPAHRGSTPAEIRSWSNAAVGTALHLSLPVSAWVELPAAPADLLTGVGMARIVTLTGDPSPAERELANRLLRGLARRSVMPLGAQIDEVGLVAQLVTGGAFEIDAPLPPRVQRAIEAARGHPEWFQRPAPVVGLGVPVAALADPTLGPLADAWLRRAAAGLDQAGLAWTPVYLGDDEVLPVRRMEAPLTSLPWLLFPPDGTLSGEHRSRVAESSQRLGLVIEGRLNLWLDQLEWRVPPMVVERLDSGELARRFRALRDGLDPLDPAAALVSVGGLVPEGVRVDLFDALDLGQRTVHLRGSSDQSFELAHRIPGLALGEGCTARLHHPLTGRTEELPCQVGSLEPPRLFTEVPPIDTWAVLELRRAVDWASADLGAWRIEAATPRALEGASVTIRPVGLPGDPIILLSLPEWLRSDQDLMAAGPEMTHEATESADGTDVTLRSRSSTFELRSRLRGRPGGVDIEMTVTNLSPYSITGLEAMLCAKPTSGGPFAPYGTEGLRLRSGGRDLSFSEVVEVAGDAHYPEAGGLDDASTALVAVDGTRRLVLEARDGSLAGGNASLSGVCIHARVPIGRVAPRRTATGRATIELQDGFAAGSSILDIARPAENANPFRVPCTEGWQAHKEAILEDRAAVVQ
jgi:hypothetical protein